MSADTHPRADPARAARCRRTWPPLRPPKAWSPRPDWTRRIPNGVGFLLTNLIDALAPGNNPLLNLAPVFDAPGTYVYDH